MDIVLLNSGPKSPPGSNGGRLSVYRTLGPYKVAHSCRLSGFSVKVIDHVLHFTQSELLSALKKCIDSKTLVLGISTTFIAGIESIPHYIINAVAAISKEYPNLKIIMGGYHTVISKTITEFDTYAVINQYGEDIFKDVVNFIAGKTAEPKFTIDFNTVSNKMIRVYSEPLFHTHNIETDAFRFHPDDTIVAGETLPLEISRGCIFKCKFCNHLLLGRGKLDYLRNFELVKEELIYNYNNWGTTSYYIICDTFNDTVYKMSEWHKMISSLPFKIKYTAYLRADLLDKFRDVPYMLQESGLVSCFHGIESLNRESALLIGKGWSSTNAKTFIPELYHNIWKKEVAQTLSFIVGLPGDTKENNLDTISWFIDNDLYHILFQPLGLTANKELKNLSEFEKNSEKYGYTFDKGVTDYGNWKNNYWSLNEASNFVKTVINPRLLGKRSIYSSWLIAQYLGLGIHEDFFKNKSSRVPDSIAVQYLKDYKSLLIS
jgi:radical SAM superfamily enzyme YgiQ (UPF0313 family)